MKNCPDCDCSVSDNAAVCFACGVRLVGKVCPECAEKVRNEANKCRHCGHNFARQEKIAVMDVYVAEGAYFPTLMFRQRFIPQKIYLSAQKIRIQTWGYFWLSRTDDEIPWEKMAGYHYHSGFIWDGVEIQTRGQQSYRISCLTKKDGAMIKTMLERMKE